MRNILETSYAKCSGDTIPRPFSKKLKTEHIFGSIVYCYIQLVFIVSQVEGDQKLKLGCRALAFTSCKAFLKNNKRSGTILPASFSACFLKKNMLTRL